MNPPATQLGDVHIALRIKIHAKRLLQWIGPRGDRPTFPRIPTTVDQRHLWFSGLNDRCQTHHQGNRSHEVIISETVLFGNPRLYLAAHAGNVRRP